jgi:sulfur-carrier protein
LKISFHATIRDAAGASEAEVDAASVRELLDRLREIFGAKMFDLLVDKGNLREDVVILVNGRNILLCGGIDANLSPGDDVAIFPPVSGG